MNLDTPIALYFTPDGKVALKVRLEQDSVWLRQEQMSELFGRERSVITKHLRNVFSTTLLPWLLSRVHLIRSFYNIAQYPCAFAHACSLVARSSSPRRRDH